MRKFGRIFAFRTHAPASMLRVKRWPEKTIIGLKKWALALIPSNTVIYDLSDAVILYIQTLPPFNLKHVLS